MVQLSVKQGLYTQAPFWFSCYAMVLFPMNQLQEAFRYSDLALDLKEKLGVKEIRSNYVNCAYISHWRHHSRQCLDTLLEIYNLGFEVGDVEYSLLASCHYCFFLFICGKELNHVDQEIEKINSVTRKYNMETAYNYNAMLHRIIINFLGNADFSATVNGDKYNVSETLEIYNEINDRVGIFLHALFSSQLSYIFGDIANANKEIEEANKYLDAGSGGMYQFAIYYFYRSLINLSGVIDIPQNKQKKLLQKVDYYNSKLKFWAKYAPMNFGHKHQLVSAEMARVSGDVVTAEDKFEKAINGAHENEFLQEEALAYELAARFYYQRGLEQFSALYFTRALACYSKWGAAAKVRHLRSEWSNLISSLGRDYIEIDCMENGSDTTSASGSKLVDLQTVLKASQAISGEIILERLLEQLMKILIENAGAQRGILFFERKGKLYIEAESDRSGNIEVLSSVPIEEYSNVPYSVINYVFQTNENLVLDNAFEDERFLRDPYIEENRIKSILCAPIRQKSEVTSIVYLDNNLTTRAFTPDRLELLRVISSQAAISIQNARLFEVARRDGLTELINRRYFMYSLQTEIEEAKRNNNKVFLLMLDIDHFKELNDTYGHQAGDVVLQEVAGILKVNAPDKDMVGRYGGEEFAVILPGLEEDTAKSRAEKIRRDVENHTVSYNGDQLQITISVGMAAYPFDASNGEGLVNYADKAMYCSKEAGRNRVTVFDD